MLSPYGEFSYFAPLLVFAISSCVCEKAIRSMDVATCRCVCICVLVDTRLKTCSPASAKTPTFNVAEPQTDVKMLHK